MLRLRPYKSCDAAGVVSWIKDEVTFYRWSAGRFGVYPIKAEDLNQHYAQHANTGDMFGMVAYDETGVVGHLLMRFLDEEKTVLRFGFVIVDDSKRGKGYGRELMLLALKYAFELLKVEKVTIGVFEDNKPAYHCYRAVGFQEAAPEKTKYYHILNEEWKCLELEMVREHWDERGV